MAAPTRSATGSTSSFHTGRVASTHSARLQATAEPAPEGSDVTPSSHRSARRTASSTAERSAGPTLASLVPSAVPCGDGLAGDLLGHVPVHRAALVARASGRAAGRRRPGRWGSCEPNIAANGLSAPGPPAPAAETERVRPGPDALPPWLVLLLALVAVLRLLRRKAESEWGVTHGFPRLVGPPARPAAAARHHHPA